MLELNYDEIYNLSISQPEKVWDELGKEVVWNKPYTSVVEEKESLTPKWFVDGEINMSYNCLDKHIEDGYGDNVAVIYECPLINVTKKITYKRLLKSVELLAGLMVNKFGIIKEDKVLLCFPVIPQGLIAMLACTRIGVPYVIVYGRYGSEFISHCISKTEPKLILTCNVGFEPGKIVKYKDNIDEAIRRSQFKPNYCIVYNRPNTEMSNMITGRDFDWKSEIKNATPQGIIPMKSDHPMFIIFTSGSTDDPKGLVMGTGRSVVSYKYIMKYVFCIKRQDCWWMLSDFGWISGQTLIVYGPLLNGCSTILYEGKPVNSPDIADVAQIMKRNEIVGFGSSPTAIRIMRKTYPESSLKLSYNKLKAIYFGGEISNSELREWISKTFSCKAYNLWGQTELGVVATGPVLGFKRSNYDVPLPLLNVAPTIVNSKTGKVQPRETHGKVLLKTPLPPISAMTIYQNHEKYIKSYLTEYPGFFDTMDYGMLMNDGSLKILSRVDDVIHVSSIRISAGDLENTCLKNQSVSNAAVVTLNSIITGQVPFAFLEIKKFENENHKQIIEETIELVKDHFGDCAQFNNAVVVPELPRNINGKILRKSLSKMINAEKSKIPINVDNVAIYKAIHEILIKAGYKSTLPDEI